MRTLGRLALKHQVLYPVLHINDIGVVLVNIWLGIFCHQSARYDAWVRATGLEHENVCEDLQKDAYAENNVTMVLPERLGSYRSIEVARRDIYHAECSDQSEVWTASAEALGTLAAHSDTVAAR